MMEWEYIGFEKVLLDVTSGNVKIQKKDYNEKGLIPIIDQGQEYSEGFTDNEELSFKGELPVIVFGDHTRVIKYVDERFCLGADGVRVLKPQAYYDAKFLFYYLNYSGIPSKGYSRHFKFLKEKQFPFLALSEQRRIVEILDQADEIRKLRKQADEKVEKIIPALFYKMFGDPISNSKNFPTKPILKLGNVVTGLTPPSKFEGMWGGEIPFITPGDLENKNGTVQRFVTTKGAKNSKVVRKGSTLVCCIGASIGKVDKARVLSAFNQQINAVEWDLKHIYDNYGLYVMRFLRPILISKGTSTTLPILKKSVFEQIFIPVPPLADQIKFSKFVDQFEQTLTNCYSSNDKIQILFNVILAKAFDGSLTASWREAHMKELLKEMEEQKKYLEQVK